MTRVDMNHMDMGMPGTAENTRGLHGMLLFGTDVLYLSHLPMFMSPHQFQVILEVTFDEAATAALAADRGAPDLHTFRPEIFAITELDPDGGGPARTSIAGTIFHGHFERGGSPLASATATVREVVYFGRLDVQGKHNDDQELGYLCFGREGQLHLAHDITASPDFDQILSVEPVAGTVTDPSGRPVGQELTGRFDRAVPVRFGGRTDTPQDRLAPGQTADADFFQTVGPTGSHGVHVDLAVRRQWYLELGELGS